MRIIQNKSEQTFQQYLQFVYIWEVHIFAPRLKVAPFFCCIESSEDAFAYYIIVDHFDVGYRLFCFIMSSA